MTPESGTPSMLVGVDGSAPSNHAVEWAVNEAEQRGAALHFVHVLPGELRGAESERAAICSAAQSLLSSAVDRAVGVLGGAAVSQEVLNAPTDQALVTTAADFDLLVVGSRGDGGFASLLFGSSSANLASHAHCPLAVVRGAPADSGPTEPPPDAPIVVGVDESPRAQQALEYAFARAAERGARIIAVCAWHPPTSYGAYAASELIPADYDDLGRDAAQKLAAALEPWQQRYPDVETTPHTVSSHAVTALVEASHDARFLVVGSRGRGTLKG